MGINFGSGDGTLTGDAGRDYFVFETSGGRNLVCDFNMSLGGSLTADQRDMPELHNADRSRAHPWDISVSGTGHGQALLSFPGGESVVLGGVSPAQVAQHGMLHAIVVSYFAACTWIT